MYLNLTMEEALQNKEFKRIIHSASAKYVKYLDPDDLHSLQMVTLWECLEKYDETAKMKFVTYLYTKIGYAIKNLIKKNKRNPFYTENTHLLEDSSIGASSIVRNKARVHQALFNSSDTDRELLEQRFYSNMTIKEIGEKNGYSKETARRKIQQALKKCEVLV
jgi:RNA polymerase sigma factor (sigma-70 family)